MNKNPLNINSNLPKWETPSIYSVKIDKMMMQISESLGDGGGHNGSGSGTDSYNPQLMSTESSTDYNPFSYNSFDENPFAE